MLPNDEVSCCFERWPPLSDAIGSGLRNVTLLMARLVAATSSYVALVGVFLIIVGHSHGVKYVGITSLDAGMNLLSVFTSSASSVSQASVSQPVVRGSLAAGPWL